MPDLRLSPLPFRLSKNPSRLREVVLTCFFELADGHEAVVECDGDAEEEAGGGEDNADVLVVGEIAEADRGPDPGHTDTADGEQHRYHERLQPESAGMQGACVTEHRFQPVVFPSGQPDGGEAQKKVTSQVPLKPTEQVSTAMLTIIGRNISEPMWAVRGSRSSIAAMICDQPTNS